MRVREEPSAAENNAMMMIMMMMIDDDDDDDDDEADDDVDIDKTRTQQIETSRCLGRLSGTFGGLRKGCKLSETSESHLKPSNNGEIV